MEPFGAEASCEPTELGRIVRQAQAGDQDAFNLLLIRFQNMAVGYCAAVLGDFQLAEDAVQDAFLETYRILPAIRIPDAFPAYLRLTLRKHCDRQTRRKRVPMIPLESAREISVLDDLAESIVTDEWQAAVRFAVRSLPEAERIAVLHFYIGQRSLKEVAAFLEVPLSTVKNRLHTARRRLRERLADQMDTTIQTTIEEQRPSNSGDFRGKTIARLLELYREQFRSEPRTADRTLLTQAREELHNAVATGASDRETMHAGLRLLAWTDDYGAMPQLMTLYLAQPLTLAEEFWAKWTRVRGLAFRREAATTVDAQRELLELVRLRIAGAPPIRLSARDPFVPTDDPNEQALSADALSIFALGIVEIGMCYHDAGVFEEWLKSIYATIDAAPKSADNRLWRFFQLRHAVHLLGLYGSAADIVLPLKRIRGLANEESDWQAHRWPIEALYLEMRLHADAKDVAKLIVTGIEATNLLNEFWKRLDPPTPEQIIVLRTLTNNVAAGLNSEGAYYLALPLWDRLASASRLGNDWSYLCYAQAVWATTGDKQRTLSLLREAAAACRFDGELQKSFQEKAPAFANDRSDAEFLAAIRADGG